MPLFASDLYSGYRLFNGAILRPTLISMHKEAINQMRSFDIFLQFASLIVLLLLPATLSAQVLPISNSRMQTPSPVIHNKASMPTGWNLEAGDAADVRAWKSPGANAIAIGKGAVVSKTIDVSAIAEKVATQNDDWRLILAVDVSGKVGKKGKSEIQLAIRELSLIHISEPTRQAKSRMPSSA